MQFMEITFNMNTQLIFWFMFLKPVYNALMLFHGLSAKLLTGFLLICWEIGLIILPNPNYTAKTTTK